MGEDAPRLVTGLPDVDRVRAEGEEPFQSGIRVTAHGTKHQHGSDCFKREVD